jgi:transcriptional regulator with XRE-family HTH domain
VTEAPTRKLYALPEVREVIAALCAVRMERGWSQDELADRMSADQAWVSSVESGRRPDPQISTIIRMVKALGVTAALTLYDPHTGDSWLITLGASDAEVVTP